MPKWRYRGLCTLLLLTLISVVVFPVWADEPDDQAQVVWKKIQKQLAAGKELEACKEALKMAPFSQTPTYAEAKGILAKRGIFLEAPLHSYTTLRIVELENQTEVEHGKTRDLPKPGIRKGTRDAWGNPLQVEIMSQEGYLYGIRSAGPDKKYLTKDDLFIGVRAHQSTDAMSRQGQGESLGDLGRKSMMKGGGLGRPGDPPEQWGALPEQRPMPGEEPAPGGEDRALEKEVSLDELLNR